jgi:hypothetical protein
MCVPSTPTTRDPEALTMHLVSQTECPWISTDSHKNSVFVGGKIANVHWACCEWLQMSS